MGSRNVSDERLVRDFLRSVADLSQREVGRRVEGVTQKDVSRWERDDWEYLTAAKRRALREHLGYRTSGEEQGLLPSPLGDPTGSPAERLIYYFSHPDAVRQLGPAVSAEDRVKAAYAIAIEDGWDEAEIDKLDRWRREVRNNQGVGHEQQVADIP